MRERKREGFNQGNKSGHGTGQPLHYSESFLPRGRFISPFDLFALIS